MLPEELILCLYSLSCFDFLEKPLLFLLQDLNFPAIAFTLPIGLCKLVLLLTNPSLQIGQLSGIELQCLCQHTILVKVALDISLEGLDLLLCFAILRSQPVHLGLLCLDDVLAFAQ